jgi:hypothetical protein
MAFHRAEERIEPPARPDLPLHCVQGLGGQVPRPDINRAKDRHLHAVRHQLRAVGQLDGQQRKTRLRHASMAAETEHRRPFPVEPGRSISAIVYDVTRA